MNILSEDGLKTLMSEIKAFVKGKVPTKTSQLTNDSNYITEANALIDKLGANRFAFINPDAVTIEYSADSGATWSDAGKSNENKQSLFTTINNSAAVSIGDNSLGRDPLINDQTRITLTLSTKENVYLNALLQKILICFEGKSHSCEVKLETRTGSNYLNNTNEWATVGVYKLPDSVDMDYTYIPLDLMVGGDNWSTSNAWQIRFTFYYTKFGKYNRYNAYIKAIFAYGWYYNTAPSPMGETGHLYSYDMNQNATFPAEVTATNFKGKINGYTVDKSVPSDAQFTDTTYDLTPYAKTVDVDTKLSTKADKNTSVIITLPSTGWTFDNKSDGVSTYTISIPVEGITADDDLVIDIYVDVNWVSPVSLAESRSIARIPGATQNVCGTAIKCETEFAKIKYAESLDGQIKFYSTEASLGRDITLLVRKL